MAKDDVVMYFTDMLEARLKREKIPQAVIDEIIKDGVSRPNNGIGSFAVNLEGAPSPKPITIGGNVIYIEKKVDITIPDPDLEARFFLVMLDAGGTQIGKREIEGKVPPRSD